MAAVEELAANDKSAHNCQNLVHRLRLIKRSWERYITIEQVEIRSMPRFDGDNRRTSRLECRAFNQHNSAIIRANTCVLQCLRNLDKAINVCVPKIIRTWLDWRTAETLNHRDLGLDMRYLVIADEFEVLIHLADLRTAKAANKSGRGYISTCKSVQPLDVECGLQVL